MHAYVVFEDNEGGGYDVNYRAKRYYLSSIHNIEGEYYCFVDE